MFRLPLVALLLLSVAPLAAAQTVLSGRLLTPEGEPYPGALVRLESGRIGPGVVDSTRTDDAGAFELRLPEPVTYGLGLWSAGESVWVPLLADAAAGRDTLAVEVRGVPGRALASVAVTSDVPLVADVAELYLAAERHHRNRPTSPALDAFAARADSLTAAAPLDRKEAVRDSLRAIGGALYAAVAVPRVEAFLAPLAGEDRPLMRQGYALWAVDKVHVDSARAALLFETVPPLSPLWSYEGTSSTGVGNVIGYAGKALGAWEGEGPTESFAAYVEALAYEHPDPNVRRQAARRVFDLARATDDEEGARAAYDRLARDFPDSRELETIRRSWADDRALRPGEPLPAFAFQALGDSAATVATGDVAGTTYLLDFWGSWCAPCIAELPALHALYEAYRPEGFEIVSVATYDTPADVAALQARGYPMPWLHAIVPDDGMEAARARFEFTGVPSAILVGPDGRIVAEGEGARGEALEAALRSHFAER